MAKRVVSTLSLWILVFVVLRIFRTGGALVFLAAMSVLTLREFYQLMAASGSAPFAKLGMVIGGLITLGPWLQERFGCPQDLWLPLAVAVFSVRILGERIPEKRVSSLASTVFGLVYVALMLRYLVRIVTPHPGDLISSDGRLLLCVWAVAAAKLCDTGALLSGLAAGRHRMSPQISPKKTWEGAVGGVLVSMLVSAAFAWFARGELGFMLSPGRAALYAIPIAVLAIVSDLVESIFKRGAAIKDSGSSVPGIGGVFDVTDSLLLTAPVAFFLLRIR